MDPNALGGMLFTLLMTIVIVGAILVFPVMRRLGAVLEVWLHDRRPANQLTADDAKALRDGVAALADRLELLEDRQSFLEQLVEGRDTFPSHEPREALPAETKPKDQD